MMRGCYRVCPAVEVIPARGRYVGSRERGKRKACGERCANVASARGACLPGCRRRPFPFLLLLSETPVFRGADTAVLCFRKHGFLGSGVIV